MRQHVVQGGCRRGGGVVCTLMCAKKLESFCVNYNLIFLVLLIELAVEIASLPLISERNCLPSARLRFDVVH